LINPSISSSVAPSLFASARWVYRSRLAVERQNKTRWIVYKSFGLRVQRSIGMNLHE
jgi:hypothetical protein